MDGILNVDKPAGMTSHDVVNQVRRISGLRRIGHAGTLDPLATGVLLMGVGKGTRLLEYLQGLPKVYEAVIRLGQTTNTYDAEGEVVAERPLPTLTTADIEAALAPLRGVIQQKPPIFSALRKDGKRLYQLARQGEVVDVPAREVTVYELTLLAWESPLVSVRVLCSTGTYIRSLAHDLGESLGCGGHIAALCRTAVGDFASTTAVPLEEITAFEQQILPLDTAVAHLARLDLTGEEAVWAKNGRFLPLLAGQPTAEQVRAYAPDGRLVGVLRRQAEYWQAEKILI